MFLSGSMRCYRTREMSTRPAGRMEDISTKLLFCYLDITKFYDSLPSPCWWWSRASSAAPGPAPAPTNSERGEDWPAEEIELESRLVKALVPSTPQSKIPSIRAASGWLVWPRVWKCHEASRGCAMVTRSLGPGAALCSPGSCSGHPARAAAAC